MSRNPGQCPHGLPAVRLEDGVLRLLSAGRDRMSRETQLLCFLAGADSVFYGEKLLTAPNPSAPRGNRWTPPVRG